jgi:hypothetical protein
MPFETQDLPPTGAVTPPATPGTTEAPAAPAASADHNRVFLVAGERAFKDPQSAVKHIESAQAHIATLEGERQADREKIQHLEAEVARMKKIVDALDGRAAPGTAAPTQPLSNEQIAEQAANLAVGLIASAQTESQRKSNLDSSEAAAKEAYGEKYKDEVARIAASLGMSLKAVDALGMESPEGFKTLFLPKTAAPAQPTRGSVTAPAGAPQTTPPKGGNIVKMREKDRISHVASKMKAAGVAGY